MSKGVGDTTVFPLQGNNDSAADLTSWENSLFKFFYVNHINNTAIRAVLATISLTKNAGDWWIAHKSRREKLTLSWPQLRELVQVELVPAAARGLTSAAWADLVFDGDLDKYFAKVRKMSHVYPLPPRELQIMASRPFGSTFVERVRGASAQQGPMGITLPDWETMARAYVREQETNPNFQSWGRGGLEPVHRTLAKLRQVRADDNWDWLTTQEELGEPDLPSDIPEGMEEEEWASHVACLYSTFATTPSGETPTFGYWATPMFCVREWRP